MPSHPSSSHLLLLGQSTWLGFLEIWLGSLHQQPPLPLSWDELLEWASLLSSWRLIPHHDRLAEKHTMRDLSPLMSTRNDEGSWLEFRPLLDANMTDKVDRLPSFSWIDRAVFYHQNVRNL